MTTIVRNRIVAPIAKIFAINDDLATRAFGVLTDEQLWMQSTERTNPMFWIVGHFVQTRTELMALLGDAIDTGWGERFVRGATVGAAVRYPSRQDVQRVMSDVSRRLQAKLTTLDDEAMSRPPTVSTPGTETIADVVAGFALHDCYHVGQMGYLVKAFGHPALAG